jgi:DNA processing protein
MEPEDIPACLALLGLRGPGSHGALRLLCRVPSARAALALGTPELAALGLRPETVDAVRRLGGRPGSHALRARDWLGEHRVRVCSIHDRDYPARLRATAGAPPVLFLQGAGALLDAPSLAIVGSRRPTPVGRELAAEIAAALCGYGLCVVSGLAIGIDSAAHLGALAADGRTIAVLGTGLDRVYPRRNEALARRIVASGGLLASEFPPGTPPEPANFPRRNRIVSGLSLGVLVVEAALPSGSLLTAQHAAEQGREVMAMPGAVRSPVSRGCHELLRNGAALVETAEDVLRALGDRFAPNERPVVAQEGGAAPEPRVEGHERQVLAATGFDETSADVLAARTGLDAAAVASALVMLELRGLVERGAGGYARRA